MKEISQQLRVTLSELVSEIDTNRQQSNLSSAIRLFVLDHFKSRSEGEPRARANRSQDLAESPLETR
jgi:predicted DNA-binding ribbon-helix-helix protein